MSPGGGLSPGTSLFSIFLSPALLLPPTFFFLPFLRGFFIVDRLSDYLPLFSFYLSPSISSIYLCACLCMRASLPLCLTIADQML